MAHVITPLSLFKLRLLASGSWLLNSFPFSLYQGRAL